MDLFKKGRSSYVSGEKEHGYEYDWLEIVIFFASVGLTIYALYLIVHLLGNFISYLTQGH